MATILTEEPTLESKSLWYKYKTTVWLQESAQEVVVHNIMRVLRSIRNLKELAYLSVPITSSKFLYELQLNHPLMLKREMVKRAIEHNYHVGCQLVKDLKTRLACPVIYPADFVPVHQQWEQNYFQALWLNIIAELCTEVHMCEGWEYSNGGSEEFTHTMQLKLGLPKHHDLLFFNTKNSEGADRDRMKNITVYDHRGHVISLQNGARTIENSLSWLRDHGFNAKRLENCLDLLRWTDDMIQRDFYQ